MRSSALRRHRAARMSRYLSIVLHELFVIISDVQIKFECSSLTWLWYSMPMLSVLTRMAKRIPRWKYSLSTSSFTFNRIPHTYPTTCRTSVIIVTNKSKLATCIQSKTVQVQVHVDAAKNQTLIHTGWLMIAWAVFLFDRRHTDAHTHEHTVTDTNDHCIRRIVHRRGISTLQPYTSSL